jgi:hypothetical protein
MTATPRWVQILASEPRWPKQIRESYIQDIDQRYGHLDLTSEAHCAYEWLECHPKGKKVKLLLRFWLNWLRKADQPYVSNGLNGNVDQFADLQRSLDDGAQRAEERQKERTTDGTR